MHVLGLDVGTTGCKACVFDAAGEIKGYGFREYDVICTVPGMGEQDAGLVWELTQEVVREAVGHSGVKDIVSLSLSVQGDAIIALDADFNPLYHAILGMDYRSEPQARWCAEKFGDRELFDRTGMRPHPMNSAVKMLWLRETHPDVYRSAKRITTYADFVAGRLCGEAAIDYTMASRTMAFDIASRQWAGDLLEGLGIDAALLSKPVPSGETIGTVTSSVATLLGLPRNVAVVAGGHDQTCAALGAGVIVPGKAVISTGTAEVLSSCFNARASNDTMFSNYYPEYIHACPDSYFTFALLHVGGIVFKWYRDNVGFPEVSKAKEANTDPYDEIVAGMPKGPSPVMVVPHFNGSGTPWCDMAAKGCVVGMNMSTTRHDIAKAVLEGLCFELRINLDTLETAGIGVNELAAVGGGARSKEWLQLKADILGCSIRTPAVREAACLGAGLLAGAAVGMFDDLGDAVKSTVRYAQTFRPSEQSAAYNERFAVYQKVYPAIKEVNALL